MSIDALQSVRYAGECADADEIVQLDAYRSLVESVQSHAALGSVRKSFLADSVRIDRNLLPDLDAALDATCERLGLSGRIECYVHNSPTIQAGVARSRSGYIILLASAAIERLTSKELEFVCGHEIGHVAYGHLDWPNVSDFARDQRLPAKLALQLLAWSRKKEISADRAGLVACGSLDAAASALFKTASGLSIPGLKVNPLELGAQFDALQHEIFCQGAEELGMWTMSHPLVPLRMKSLALFWATELAASNIREAPGGRDIGACDREIAAMLACMDPLAQRGDTDPTLRPLVTWAGLYIAGCNGRLLRNEIATLAAMVGEGHLQQAMAAGPQRLSRFRDELLKVMNDRTTPLCALDVNRLFTLLIAIARADGGIEAAELHALYELASHMHVVTGYIDALVRETE
jgi:hypothetical protein